MNLLRDYQNKAIEDLRFHFRRGKKRLLRIKDLFLEKIKKRYY